MNEDESVTKGINLLTAFGLLKATTYVVLFGTFAIAVAL